MKGDVGNEKTNRVLIGSGNPARIACKRVKKTIVVGMLASQVLIAYSAVEKQDATHCKGETERIETVMRMLAAVWGDCGTTPFFYLVQLSTSSRAGSAVLSNQVATVRLLLKHGADPNKRQGLFRKTSLEYAAMRNGDIELIKALVEGGAETTDEMIVNVENTEVKRYLQGIKKKECQKVSFGEKGKDELLQ